VKRFNCAKASCEICSKATVVVGIFGIKKYKCFKERKPHKIVKAKDCLSFRCNSANDTRECKNCRKGEPRK